MQTNSGLKHEGTVAVALDQGSSISYSIGREIQAALTAFRVEVPALGTRRGNLLDDQLLPSFRSADIVIVVWSTSDPLWQSFQLGLAHALGKRTLSVAYDEASRHVAIDVDDTAQLISEDRNWDAMVRGLTSDLRGDRRVGKRRVGKGAILLCPRESSRDRKALARLREALPERTLRRLGGDNSSDDASSDVLWVITSYELNTKTGAWSNLGPNVVCAYEAGANYAAAVQAGIGPRLAIARLGDAPPILALDHLVVAQSATVSGLIHLLAPSASSHVPTLTRLELRDVKCFESIVIPLSVESPLGGAWTCIAGLNGAGKSTILQGIALALLGRRRVVELGIGRLARMVRRTAKAAGNAFPRAEIRLTVRTGSDEVVLTLALNEQGPDESRLMSLDDLPRMDRLWEALGTTLVVSYGATRNLSDRPTGQQSMSPMAQRQLTLFDSLAQIVSAEALTVGGVRFRPALATLARMLSNVLSEPDAPFNCSVNADGQLQFVRGGSRLESIDLPDGFRSMVALLADIAQGWHELHPDVKEPVLEDITGIVLVDELDLHLHARLQRQIVPRLRTALPGIQWIVTTHSPLIVTSFESSELIVLDKDAPTGIRELDREVLAFSPDEVYDWLLDTRPLSEAGAAQLASDPGGDLLYQSPSLNAEQAKQLSDMQGELLTKLARTKA